MTKIVQYDLPAVTATTCISSTDIAVNATTATVDDASSFAANDFVLIEIRGNEKNEILKISSILSNVITFTTGFRYAHTGTVIFTKLTYDKVRIERSDDNVSYAILTTETLKYNNMYSMIEYIDDTIGSGDNKYYRVSYGNSHTSVYTAQTTLYNQDNYSYISAAQFRAETGYTTSNISDNSIYDALNAGVELIQSKVFVQKMMYGTSTADTVYNVLLDYKLQYGDRNADRTIDKNDLLVFEFDAQKQERTYINYLIERVDPETQNIYFTEAVPRDGRELTFVVYGTRSKYEDIRSSLKQINKLCAINYILKNVLGSAVKSGQPSWTAGGTTVNKDISATNAVVEQNEKEIKELLQHVVGGMYYGATKLRTTFSSLNYRYGGQQPAGMYNYAGGGGFRTQGGNFYPPNR